MSVLTEEQRASMREAMAGEREKIRELEQKIREARKELFELGIPKIRRTVVREKALAAAKIGRGDDGAARESHFAAKTP